jgi:HD-GYP domain-containing protein (c-di-GMP phosphodiesterase class II)
MAGVIHDVGKIAVPAEMVYQHHERMNGSGYPLGLKEMRF